MSQGQPRRALGEAQTQDHQPPVKYGDVFDVSGELADQPVAPRDAALLQSAEQTVLGQTQKGGPAAVLQSAAALNARAGHVGRGQTTGPAADAGATVTEAELPGCRVVTESVGGQVVATLMAPARVVSTHPSGALDQDDAVTIGRAMEAVAATAAGDKPVDQGDAAAVQAAEMRATGSSGVTVPGGVASAAQAAAVQATEISATGSSGVTVPGGVASAAQAAADRNARTARDEDKAMLRNVLSNAREKMPADKGATREDAERVVSAEIRNKPDLATTRGGVADAVTTAARLNQERPRP